MCIFILYVVLALVSLVIILNAATAESEKPLLKEQQHTITGRYSAAKLCFSFQAFSCFTWM